MGEDPTCGDCGKHVPITSMWQNFRNSLLTCNSCLSERVTNEKKEVWEALHAVQKYLHTSSDSSPTPSFATVYLDIHKILGRYNW